VRSEFPRCRAPKEFEAVAHESLCDTGSWERILQIVNAPKDWEEGGIKLETTEQ
jgi:hypothetical protein